VPSPRHTPRREIPRTYNRLRRFRRPFQSAPKFSTAHGRRMKPSILPTRLRSKVVGWVQPRPRQGRLGSPNQMTTTGERIRPKPQLVAAPVGAAPSRHRHRGVGFAGGCRAPRHRRLRGRRGWASAGAASRHLPYARVPDPVLLR